jgi:hypothetical protein
MQAMAALPAPVIKSLLMLLLVLHRYIVRMNFETLNEKGNRATWPEPMRLRLMNSTYGPQTGGSAVNGCDAMDRRWKYHGLFWPIHFKFIVRIRHLQYTFSYKDHNFFVNRT